MRTCRDCFHYDVCQYHITEETNMTVNECNHFKDKAKIVEIHSTSRERKKRKYYRKCGVCGERHEQGKMIRTYNSPNGWLCFDCHKAEHPEYEEFGEV